MAKHKLEKYLCNIKKKVTDWQYDKMAMDDSPMNEEARMLKAKLKLLADMDPKTVLLSPENKTLLFEIAKEFELCENRKAFDAMLARQTTKSIRDKLIAVVTNHLFAVTAKTRYQVFILTCLLYAVENVVDIMLEDGSVEEIKEVFGHLNGCLEPDCDIPDDDLKFIKSGNNQ